MKGRGVPRVSLVVSLLSFVSRLRAFVRCLAKAREMLRLVVYWNHMEGVAVW